MLANEPTQSNINQTQSTTLLKQSPAPTRLSDLAASVANRPDATSKVLSLVE